MAPGPHSACAPRAPLFVSVNSLQTSSQLKAHSPKWPPCPHCPPSPARTLGPGHPCGRAGKKGESQGAGRHGEGEQSEATQGLHPTIRPGAGLTRTHRGGHNPCFSLKDEEDGLLGRVWRKWEQGEMVSEGNEKAHRLRTTQPDGGWA